jgi:hypothetical protein
MPEFICLCDAYHGTTLGVLSQLGLYPGDGQFIGGARFNQLTRQFIRVPNPSATAALWGWRKNLAA